MSVESLKAGAMLGRYRIGEKLGSGGFGEVVRAYDTKLQRWVAIKVLTREGSERARLVAEARAAAALTHPNVISVYEIDDDSELAFMVMELVEGSSLRQRAPTASITLKLQWMGQIASALAAAHRAGLIHRDIKPGNLLIANATESVKVLDFGIAKRLHPIAPTPDAGTYIDLPATSVGRVVGTLRYLSPEQLMGERPSPAVDQWAWGVVSYELLSGLHPAQAAGSASFEGWIVGGRVEPLGPLAPDAPPSVVAVVMRALSRSPADRFPTMDAVCAALSSALGVAPRELAHEGAVRASQAPMSKPMSTVTANVPPTATSGLAVASTFAATKMSPPIAGGAPEKRLSQPVTVEPTRVSPTAEPPRPSGPPGPNVSFAPPHVVGPAPPRPSPGAAAAEIESSATYVFLFGIVATVIACAPLGIVGIVFGGRLVRRARVEGVAVPALGIAGMVLSTLSFVVSVVGGLFAYGAFHQWSERGERAAARVAELEQQVAQTKTAPVLDAPTACALTELYLRRGGESGWSDKYVRMTCPGPLVSLGERKARLEDIDLLETLSSSSPEVVDACFARTSEWRVTKVARGCGDPSP